MKLREIFIVLMFLGAPLGCRQGASSSTTAGLCSSDEDCAAEDWCQLPFGICVSRQENPLTISLKITPLSSTGLLVEQTGPIHVGFESFLSDLWLRQPARLTGAVTVSCGAEEAGCEREAVGARIVATLQGTIPGVPLLVEASAEADQNPSFEMDLALGSYDITVYPDEETGLPPLLFPDVVVGGDERMDFTLPAWSSYILVKGRILRHGEGEPLAGLTVQGVDQVTGYQSTQAKTDEEGRFQVSFPPGVGRASFVASGVCLAPSGTAQTDLMLQLHQENVDLPEGVGLVVLEDMVAFEFTPQGLSRLEGVVQGEVGDLLGMGLEGTVITFEADMGLGTVTAQVETEAGGAFVVSLVEGTYRVTLAPPLDSEFAIGETTVTLEAGRDEPLVFSLEPKHMLAGVVRDARTAAVPGVQIDALLTKDSSVSERIRTTLSREDGAYSFHLDPGTYDVTCTPPPQSGLPMRTVRGLVVHSAVRAREWEIDLDPASVISGTVLAPDGAPLIDATVEVFAMGEDGSELIGQSTTDRRGSYQIVIPNPRGIEPR